MPLRLTPLRAASHFPREAGAEKERLVFAIQEVQDRGVISA